MAKFVSPGGEAVESDNPGVIAFYQRKGYTAADEAEAPDQGEAVALDDMTVAQLREHAKAEGINLAGATKKDEILAAIQGAEEPVPPHDPPAPADPDAADPGNPPPSSDPDQSQE